MRWSPWSPGSHNDVSRSEPRSASGPGPPATEATSRASTPTRSPDRSAPRNGPLRRPPGLQRYDASVHRSLSRRHALRLCTVAAASYALPGCRGKADPAAVDPEADAATAPLSSSAAVRSKIHANGALDGDGATLQRLFPSPQLRHLDPFVLLDDFDVRAPAGFPTHPHRGFEAFTYMIDGAFEHRDTMGNVSTITAGGTQRFNSGRGAKHSEMPGSGASNRGLQLWVNLPRRLKRMEPEYTGTPGPDLPRLEDERQRTRIISGSNSPVALHTDVDYRDVTVLADAWSTLVPEQRNTLIYVLDGTATVAAHTARRGEALLVDAGLLTVRGTVGTRFAYLSGRPHHEPIRQRGPFVD